MYTAGIVGRSTKIIYKSESCNTTKFKKNKKKNAIT